MIKFVIILVFIILIALYFIRKKKNIKVDDKYDSFLKTIKKAFNNVLVRVNDVPRIENKILIRLNHIDDLVDICEMVKKPIYYIEDNENKTCDFILLNNDEYCLYTLKENDNKNSLFDKYYLNEQDKHGKINNKILEDLDKTTIIKLQNGDSFKVSPLKNRDLKKLNRKEFLANIDSEIL